jgi:hypothetical protein
MSQRMSFVLTHREAKSRGCTAQQNKRQKHPPNRVNLKLLWNLEPVKLLKQSKAFIRDIQNINSANVALLKTNLHSSSVAEPHHV